MTEEEEFAAAFNEDEPAAGAPDTGGGMELPAEAVAAAEEEETGATPTPDPLDAPQGDGVVADALEVAADNGGGEGTVDGTVVDVSSSASTPEEGDTSTPPGNVDTTTAEGAEAGDDDLPTDPVERQRIKSWQGRLKADERVLAEKRAELEGLAAKMGAKESDDPGAGGNVDDAAAVALDSVSEQAEGSNPAMADRAEEVAGQLARGEIDADQAIKEMAADFGDGFTNMLTAIIRSETAKMVGDVRSKVDELGTQVQTLGADRDAVIEHITSDTERRHFEKLAAAKPNFAEVNADPAFDAFVQEKGGDAQAIRTGGTVKQIVDLIEEFEQSRGTEEITPAATTAAAAPTPPTETVSEEEVESATAVRGGGMQLPDEPRGTDDFAGAWNDTPDVPRRRA